MNGPGPWSWSKSTGPSASNGTFLITTSGTMNEKNELPMVAAADSAYILRELAVPVSDLGQDLASATASFLRVKKNLISNVRILRKSLDSRRRNQPLWRYTIEFT